MPDLLQHILSSFHAVDLGQLVLQRLCPHRFDRFLVHATGVIIADLFRIGLIALCFRRFLRDRVERVVVVLDQLIETAPARIFRRNFGALDPAAVGAEKKMVRWFERVGYWQAFSWRRPRATCRLTAFSPAQSAPATQTRPPNLTTKRKATSSSWNVKVLTELTK